MLDIGFDIGGTKIAAVAADEDSGIAGKISSPFPKGRDGRFVAKMLYDMATELMRGCGESMNGVRSAGIAVPGSISRDGEVVKDAYNLGFRNVPLRRYAQEHFKGIPVNMVNDANAAALAELYKGVFKGRSCAVLVTLGTGVGGGIIIDGRLFNGGRGNGVELGHAVLDFRGERCTCGTLGCAETLISASALIKGALRRVQNGCGGMMAEIIEKDGSINAKEIVGCALLGDEPAKSAFDEYMDVLAAFTASIINVFDPEVIAIGGGISGAGDALLKPLGERVKKMCFFDSPCEITISEMGNNAGAIGAAMLFRSF